MGAHQLEKKQAECESKFTAFSDIYLCTKQAFANNDRAQSDANFKLYILTGEQLAESVRLNRLTDLEAKIEWQKLFLKLQRDERNTSSAGLAAVGAGLQQYGKTISTPVVTAPPPVYTSPKTTLCQPNGGGFSCRDQ